MFTAAAVRTAIDFHSLGVSIQFFAFRPDMAQFPSIMADVIMLILKTAYVMLEYFPMSSLYARVFRFSWS